MNDWDILDGLLKGLEAEAKKATAPPRVVALRAPVSALRTDFDAQRTAHNDVELLRLGQLIRRLWNEVEEATGIAPKRSFKDRVSEQFSIGAIMGVIILIVAFGGVAWLMVAYIGASSFDALATISGTRPLLTIASIIATLAFGGGLVFAALFSDEATFESRFRMAREIFLVFSGVFATVVGFHFGSASGDSQSAASQQILESTIQEKNGKWTVTVKGGTPPYTVDADIDGVSKTAKGKSPLEVDLTGIDPSKPIERLRIRTSDAKGNTAAEINAAKVSVKGFAWPQPQESVSQPSRESASGSVSSPTR